FAPHVTHCSKPIFIAWCAIALRLGRRWQGIFLLPFLAAQLGRRLDHIIGLSATPWTKGLGAFYEQLIIAATTQDLIDQGYLSNFKVFAPSHPDLSAVHT